MNGLERLAMRWEREAETLARNLDERGASLLRLHATELREALRDQGSEELTLSEAALESGYSEDHLRHLVADGTIPNAGERGRPRIRRGDLPQKPGYDPDAIRAEARGRLRAS